MGTTPNKKENDPPSATSYKKAVAKQRRLKKLRQMKLKDRAGDVQVSDVSDVEVVGEVDEEPQDAWLNDLIKSDGDNAKVPDLPSMEVGHETDHSQNQPTKDPNQPTMAAKICAFTNENSVKHVAEGVNSSISLKALLGFGIATVVITLFARLRS